jgi:hypothetical protein
VRLPSLRFAPESTSQNAARDADYTALAGTANLRLASPRSISSSEHRVANRTTDFFRQADRRSQRAILIAILR